MRSLSIPHPTSLKQYCYTLYSNKRMLDKLFSSSQRKFPPVKFFFATINNAHSSSLLLLAKTAYLNVVVHKHISRNADGRGRRGGKQEHKTFVQLFTENSNGTPHCSIAPPSRYSRIIGNTILEKLGSFVVSSIQYRRRMATNTKKNE